MIARAAMLIAVLSASPLARARDNGQWENADPKIRAWFNALRQPDNPAVSCCGDADAYFADLVEVRDGRMLATITDSRGNPIPEGTVIEVPPHKVNKDENLIGRIIIFLGGSARRPIVFCYVPGTGA
jgi:hypothetical protein